MRGNTLPCACGPHGCGQQYEAIGNDFYKKAGYNEWADTNDLIVFIPANHFPVRMELEGFLDTWLRHEPQRLLGLVGV